MIAALRYEWVRISTVRSTTISLVLAFLAATGVAFLIAEPRAIYLGDGEVAPTEVDWFGAFGQPLGLTAVLAAIIAAQAIGQEYRFGLIRLTLTAYPRRAQILTAKLVWVVVACAVVALTSYAGSWLGVTLRGNPTPPAGVLAPDSTYLVRGVVYVVLFGLSAFAIAGVTRQTALGIGVPIVSGLIVENLLLAFLSSKAEWLVRILPWSSGGRWSQPPLPADVEPSFASGWAALGILAAWVVAFLALETLAFLRRDA